MQRHRVKDDVIVIDDPEPSAVRRGKADHPPCDACAASAALSKRNQNLEAQFHDLRTKLYEMIVLIESCYLLAVTTPHEERPAKRARAE